jgi:hypothetical protein
MLSSTFSARSTANVQTCQPVRCRASVTNIPHSIGFRGARPVGPENPDQLKYLTLVPAMITLQPHRLPHLLTIRDKGSDHATHRLHSAPSIGTWFRSRVSMQIEIVALRHQIAVYKQTVSRPHLQTSDRLFWARLSRLWPGWQDALAFVRHCQVNRPTCTVSVSRAILAA